MKQIVTTLAAALAVALAGQAHGQTDRRWTGASNSTYGTTGNWSDPDVPNTTSEAAFVDGDNGTRASIQYTTTGNTTIGQLRIKAPATTIGLYGDYAVGNNSTLSFGQISSCQVGVVG